MKHRFLGVMLTLAVGLSLALVVACGDDDSSKSTATPAGSGNASGSDQTLKSYFQQVADITTSVNSKTDQLAATYANAFVDPDDTRNYYRDFLPVFSQALSDLRNLDPPSKAQKQHEAYIAALVDFYAAQSGVADDVKTISAADALQTYLSDNSDRVGAKANAVLTACVDLQKVADDNKVAVDLQCGGSSSSPSPTGGSSTDADYFNGLETIFHDADAEGSRLQAELSQSVNSNSTVAEQITALNTFLDSSTKTFQNALDALDKLHTPSAAQSSQAAFVSAVNDALDEISKLKSDLRGVQTQADLDSALSGFDTRFTTVTSDADAACSDLQKLAGDSSVTIDLKCNPS
jgi:hypothetical protein